MHRKVLGRLLLCAGSAFALSFTACHSGGGAPAEVVTINGAGSSFVYPAMSRWTQAYNQQRSNIRINYQSIGSGGGVQQVRSGTVDFGASDYPLTDQQLSQMQPTLQIPETAGPVCITYNLPGLTQPLRLSADTIAAIFLGRITSWRDPLIAKDNPGVTLPSSNIIVAHRSDGSGTTAAFTTYLSAVSPEWKARVGAGGSVSWPVGLGGKGSEGVTAQVHQAPGGIGYVELIYAQQNNLPVASVKNQAGNYVAPSTDSTTAAIAAFSDQLNKDPRTPIVNPPASASNAYPISTLTFLMIPKDGTDQTNRAALKHFVQYIIGDGQNIAHQLNYAPLPDGVKQYDQQILSQMTVNNQPLQ